MSSQLELDENNFGDYEPEAQEFMHAIEREHPEAGIDLEPDTGYDWEG